MSDEQSMIEAPSQQGSARRRLTGDLQRGLALTSCLILLITTGVQAALLQFFNLDQALTLLGTFAKTAPLTTALVAGFYLAFWWTFRTDEEHFFGRWIFVTTVLLWAVALIGKWTGTLMIQMPPQRGGLGNPFLWVYQFLARALSGYYNAYGPAGFWSSLILAAFLIFAIYRVGLYYEER